MVKRVAVIGAGGAGLCALRHLTSHPDQFEAIAFEQLPGVGGTWRYTDKVGADEDGFPVPSSMYKNLRTNLPKEVMAFPDYPFPENLPSFMHHTDVLEYLQDYCEHFRLSRFIKFDTKVDRVEPVSTGKDGEGLSGSWQVSYSTVGEPNQTWTEGFDAVMVCNGHFSTPLIPEMKGLGDFQGIVIHSKEYRLPDMFTGQTVVCLGAGLSGMDISLDIASVAQKVIISHNKTTISTALPHNVFQQTGINHVTRNSVVFRNGEQETIDAIVFCTGYKYSFPFLTAQCGVNIEDQRVTPLYKHLINTKYPTLSFVGICNKICPFPHFHSQVKFVLKVLDGSHRLPTTEQMQMDIEMDYQQRLREGLPKRHAHWLSYRELAYYEGLAELGGFEPIPPVICKLRDAVVKDRENDFLNYKCKEYLITGEDSYEKVEGQRQSNEVTQSIPV